MSFVKAYTQSILHHTQYDNLTHIQDSRVSIFTLIRPLPIKLDLYIDHFLYRLNLPEDILVPSFMIIEKNLISGLVCPYNIHRIVFTSLTISLKFLLKSWISNKSLEKVEGMREGTLGSMESEMMTFLNWKLDFRNFYEVRQKLSLFLSSESSEVKEDELSEEELYLYDGNTSEKFSEIGDLFSD